MTSEKARLLAKHAKRMRELRRRPTCLAQGECRGVIGMSHTVSESMSLSYLAEDQHVLVRTVNLFSKTEANVLPLTKLSIHEALAFPGFCNYHDTVLFNSLDNSQFLATPEQLFMQAYRCACREYYFKAAQVDNFPNASHPAELQGQANPEEYGLHPDMEIIRLAMNRGLLDVAAHKEKFENLLVDGAYRRLQSYIIHTNSAPIIACAGSFAPDFNSNGDPLQNFTDFDKDLESIFVSIIPNRSGAFVVLSFFDDATVSPTKFIKDLIANGNLTHRIVWMCMTRIENLAIRPSWWNGLSEKTRAKLNEAINYNADLFDGRLATFDRMPHLEIVDWVVCHQFWN